MRVRQSLTTAACLGGLFGGAAFGHGGLVGDQPATVDAARTLLVRSNDELRIISQMRWTSTATRMVWLFPLPNFNDPAEDGVRVELFPDAALEAIDAATRPTFTGQSDGSPNGQRSTLEGPAYRAGATELPAVRFFNAAEIEANELTDYLATVGVSIDQGMLDTISAMLDQNFMFLTLRFDAPPTADPVVAVSYPLPAGEEPRIGIRPVASNLGDGSADMTYFAVSDARQRFNLTTRDVDVSGVAFDSPNTTTYLQAFDAQVAPQQSQAFLVEHAGAVAVDDAEAAALVDAAGGTVTRLHARLTGPALRANQVISLRDGEATELTGPFAVTGFGCEVEAPDAAEPPTESDLGVPADPEEPVDAGLDPATPDAATEAPSGGGGDGGCSLAPGPRGPGGAALLSLIPLVVGLRARSRRR